MKQNLLTTKEFAVLCKTTKRTIIHYDQIGLLKPKTKAGLNRLYTQQQVLTFEKIALLQSLGFQLSEIKKQLNNHQTLRKIFIQNKQKIAEKQRKINEQMRKVNELLNNLERTKTIIEPTIKKIAAYDYYGIEREGKYVEITKFCNELAQMIGDKKFQLTYFIIFNYDIKNYNDRDYSPTRAKMIIGAKIDPSFSIKMPTTVKKYHTKKYNAITYTHRGPHAYLGYLWRALEDYIFKYKLAPNHVTHSREIYIKSPANEKYEENYLTELQTPIIIK